MQLITTGEIRDAKTVVALQYLALAKHKNSSTP